MARDPGFDDCVIVDNANNVVKLVVNDVAQVIVTPSGSMFAEGVLSASTSQVAALDPLFQFIDADATTANFGIVLPAAASSKGKTYTVTKIDASANSVFLSGAGSDKINDAATLQIKSSKGSATVISDGVGWRVIALFSANINF